METKGDYTTQDEVQEALDMLGKGYEAPYEIHTGERVLRDDGEGLQEFETGTWIKLSTSFRNVMSKLKGSRLSVFLCICLHINKNNNCFPSLETIAEETGYSRREVVNAVQELEQGGFLTVKRGEMKSNLYHVNVAAAMGAENAPVHFPTQTSAVRAKKARQNALKEDSIKKEVKKRGDLVDLALLSTDKDKPTLDEFERVFGFNSLPWYSNTTWEKFRRFVVKVHTQNPQFFREYVAWRNDDGKYKAFSNRKIRENPVAFIDTGYPEFEASKMYRSETTQKTHLL